MPRNRIIYAEQGVFIGPAHASGAHWINTDKSFGDTTGNINLIQPLNRVQSLDYTINVQRTNILQLGKQSILTNQIVNHPTVDINISYLQNSCFNEWAAGFNVNYTRLAGTNEGIARYTNNFGVFLLSGFTTRTNSRESNGLDWPYLYKDQRNIFVGTELAGNEVNYPSTNDNFHPSGKRIVTIGFGNCYITNYRSQARVNEFPIVNIEYIGENMVTYLSGYSCPIPALSPESGLPIPNRTFHLPTNYQGDSVLSVVRPGDITIDFTQLPKQNEVLAIYGTGITGGLHTKITDLGFNFTDLKIQSYTIDIPVPRRPMEMLGYRLPIDREVTYPIVTNLTFEAIVGDTQTGRLDNLINKDDDYNITIKLRNPSAYSTPGIAIRYDFLKAKLSNIAYESQIGGQVTTTFTFITELDSDDLTKGVFMSGSLNVDPDKTIFQYLEP